jgi:cold shock CspA family protein
VRTHGTLVKWNDERGFGFIAVASGSDEVFVHVSSFPRDGRRPQVGETVSFEIQPGSDGKRKAIRVQRPGAAKPESGRIRKGKSMLARLLEAAVVIAFVAAVGSLAYRRWSMGEETTTASLPPTPLAQPLATGAAFECDGRTHCSQMRSCEEATYFLKHCPGTQMDGNNDGEPCEQQWCN